MKKKLIAFGEVLWDIYPDEKYIGGAPLNFAAHFAKGGGCSYLLSAIGDDALGKDTLSAVKALGVGTEYVSVIGSVPTGSCLVTLDESSVPSYNLMANVAYDVIDLDAKELTADAFYFGTLALRTEHNRRTVEKALAMLEGAQVLVDINIRAPYDGAESVIFALRHATVLKISDEELPTVLKRAGLTTGGEYGEICRRIADAFPNTHLIILTLGERGAFAFDAVLGEEYSCGAVRVTPISTVGAGDSFAASFLAKYLSGSGISAALEYAARVSAFVVSRKEAIPDYSPSDFE